MEDAPAQHSPQKEHSTGHVPVPLYPSPFPGSISERQFEYVSQ